MAEIHRSDHYRVQRRARLAAGAPLLYVRVGPRPHVHQELTGWLPQRQARERVRLGFADGFTVLHSPGLPFFRAIVGAKRFRRSLYVDVETWVNGRGDEGPNYFHAKGRRFHLRRELRVVESLLRGSI